MTHYHIFEKIALVSFFFNMYDYEML